MNDFSSGLQDIELAPLLSDSSLWLLFSACIFFIILASCVYLWHKRQQPLNTALRQLNHLDNQSINPTVIASIMCQAWQLKHLSAGDLPSDFVDAVQQAQFSSTSVSIAQLQLLKQHAKALLQEEST